MNLIDQLAANLEAAKIAEAAATQARLDAEAAVLAAVECKDEGSTTHRGAAYKVTVTGVVNRRVDEAALAAVRERMSAAMFERAFRFRPEVSLSGIRYLQQNEPELYAVAAQAITATPGKTQVKVEAIRSEDVDIRLSKERGIMLKDVA